MRPKLVRDKVPQIIVEDSCEPTTHIADDKEYWQELKKKLNEKVECFVRKSMEQELADLLDIIYAISDFKKFDKNLVRELGKRKKKMRGGYKKRIILDKCVRARREQN